MGANVYLGLQTSKTEPDTRKKSRQIELDYILENLHDLSDVLKSLKSVS